MRVDVNAVGLSTFQWMPHALGLVCFGGVPAYVPDALIFAIEQRLDEINAAGGELFHRLKKGDCVTIQDGPFAGYEAIFDTRLGGRDRVRVLLQLFNQRRIPVEVQDGQFKPA